MYYKRDIEEAVVEALTQFPAVLITGPRQAGKSTLLRTCLGSHHYVTLDDPSARGLALKDPALFLSTHPAPVVIDEIQHAPVLLSYIKMMIDDDRRAMGRFVLTGSQTFQLMQGVTETLAGRVAIFQLYPFSWLEVGRVPDHAEASMGDLQMAEQVVQGFFPEFFHKPKPKLFNWHSSYLHTYLERDVRNLRAISDLARFQDYVSLLATRAGGLLNLSEISKECGISHATARDWLTVLEATYVIYILRPYHTNHSKRIVKSPKLYFVDTGLLCHLLGIDSGERFLRSAERGAIFENMVVMEMVKRAAFADVRTSLFFYRTHGGLELDLLVERRGKLSAYEIKLSKTVNSKMGVPLKRFQQDHPEAEVSLLCLREEPLALAEGIFAKHWTAI